MNDVCKSQPVSSVQWIHRTELTANDYNPNHVAPPELRLLETSILEDGWTQPIVCLPDKTIVDGFHRWTVSGRKKIYALTDGFVPVVFIEVDPVHKKMSTIRHNRARGTHGVLPMAQIVQSMLEDGLSAEEIMDRLGMDDEEVERLAARVGLPIKVAERGRTEFGKAWRPDFS